MKMGGILSHTALMSLYGFFVSDTVQAPQTPWHLKLVLGLGALVILVLAYQAFRRDRSQKSRASVDRKPE